MGDFLGRYHTCNRACCVEERRRQAGAGASGTAAPRLQALPSETVDHES